MRLLTFSAKLFRSLSVESIIRISKDNKFSNANSFQGRVNNNINWSL